MFARQSLAVLCAVIALVALAGSANAVNIWKIGLNLPYTSPALGTAVSSIVNMLTMTAPSLNSLDSTGQNQFQVVPMDSQFTGIGAAQAVLSLAIDQGAVGLVGDFASTHSGPAALAGGRFRLWQCSGSSSAVTLSDKTNYPYFFRTMADDPQQGDILAQFVKAMGWTSSSVISTSDAYGSSVASAFLAAAPGAGIQILANQVLQSGQRDVSAAVQGILDGGSQIVIIAMMPQDGLFVLREAKRQGMIGPNWVWLGPEGWGIFPTIELESGDMELANGFLYVMPREASYNAGYNATVSQWASTYGANSPVPQYGFLFADCLTAVAKGILRLVNQYGAANVASRNYPADLTQFLVPFTGTTGEVVFNQANGNRFAYFSMFNFWNGAATTVYTVAPDHSVTAVATTKYFGGSTTKPRDRPTQLSLVADWSSPAGLALAVINGVVLVTILASAAYLTKHQHMQTVKNLSFPFLMLICTGCACVIISNLLGLGVPTAATCQSSLWLFVYGVQMVLASCAAKAYRLWAIFHNKGVSKLSRVSNKALFSAVSVILLIQTLLLAIWTGIGPQQAGLLSSRTYFYYTCSSANASVQSGLAGATLAYNILLLLVVTILAYKTRNVSSNFRESSFVFYAANNAAISGIVVFMFATMSFAEATLAAFVVRQIMIIYAICFAFSVLVGRLVYAVMSSIKMSMRASGSMSSAQDASKVATTTAGGGGSQVRSASGVKFDTNEGSGAVTSARGTFAIKKMGGVAAKWHRHAVSVSVPDGTIQMLPATHGPEMGPVLRLAHAQLDRDPPGKPNCIDVSAQGKGWTIQFPAAEERDKWLAVISMITGVSSSARAPSQPSKSGAAPTTSIPLMRGGVGR
ncbi:periplasmic binding protein-like I [Blastocladiella britannica]|nr:periplasmic binding protein-like I [Blastocladiella britannica]